MRARALLCAVLLVAAIAGCGSDTSPTAPPDPITRLVYAALGASDAVGIGAFPLTDGYVFLLAERMRGVRGEVDLRNLGVSGAEIEELLRDELEPAVAAMPGVVTVWAGSNDVIAGRDPAMFGAELDRLLADLTTRTDALVYVGDLADLTRAPLFRAFPDGDVTRPRIDAFNAEIRARAAANGAILVPVSSLVVEDSIFAIDGFHPNNEGHRRLADIYWSEIEPRL